MKSGVRYIVKRAPFEAVQVEVSCARNFEGINCAKRRGENHKRVMQNAIFGGWCVSRGYGAGDPKPSGEGAGRQCPGWAGALPKPN